MKSKENKLKRKRSKKTDENTTVLSDLIGVDEPRDDSKKSKTNKSDIKLYFNSDTQVAIVKFQSEKSRHTRDKIYVEDIMPAFEKLVENLINIHKFTGAHGTYEELKNDCVNFLFETIHKFDAARGTNAFSYFNVVAKNWLVNKTKQKIQRMKRCVSLDDPDSLTMNENLIIEEYSTVSSQNELFDSDEMTVNLLYGIRSRVKTENELTCINSIITIFENIDEIDLLNKSAVLLYMRELSGLSPKQMTTAMQSIKQHYKKSKLDLRED